MNRTHSGHLATLASLALLASATWASAVPRLGSAVIVRLDGKAEFTSPSANGDIDEGMAFSQGQAIHTKEDGKIVAVLTPGVILCVAPETVVELKQIEMTTEGLPDAGKRIEKNVVLDIPKGGAMRFDAGQISPNLTLRVTTEAGDVLASGGRAIVAKDGADWRVICEDAFVTFDQKGQQKTVKKGEVLTASPSAAGQAWDTRTEPLSQTGLEDQFVGCRREADRLAPVVFNVDYVHLQDLLDYIGGVDGVKSVGEATYWADVSPTTRKSARSATRLNAGPDAGIDDGGRRDPRAMWEWYGDVGVIKGVNYVPSTAVNSTEMWQKDTFDLDAIDKEFGYAKTTGYTAIRLFLPYLVWESDADGLKERMKDVLAKARKRNLKVVFVLFDDNNDANREPYLGKQADPTPGVHNSQWTPSPGPSRVTSKEALPKLEAYVRDIIGSFKNDRRILMWDLYNEPGSYGMGEQSLPLVESSFAWARDEKPVQPLTTGIWSEMGSRMSKTLMELSDVISFRAYENENDLRSKLSLCQTLGRPLVCTEWLRRDQGNTFEKVLPVFAENHVGWFHWGLVQGKTQTYMPFESKPGAPEPEVWQFDVLKPDGDAFNTEEVELVRNFVFED